MKYKKLDNGIKRGKSMESSIFCKIYTATANMKINMGDALELLFFRSEGKAYAREGKLLCRGITLIAILQLLRVH